jgi:1,4-dihydroxy-2-naphthoyl-CoA hydrolase
MTNAPRLRLALSLSKDSPMTLWFDSTPSLDSLNANNHGTLVGHLEMRVTAITEDSITVSMPVDHRTIQPHGRLHGGASVALAETVGSIAANLTLDSRVSAGVGLEINANHIRPVKKGLVFATASAEAIGNTTQVWSIKIRDERERLVCVSRFTVAVIPVVRA